jgi:hypothetical protein
MHRRHCHRSILMIWKLDLLCQVLQFLSPWSVRNTCIATGYVCAKHRLKELDSLYYHRRTVHKNKDCTCGNTVLVSVKTTKQQHLLKRTRSNNYSQLLERVDSLKLHWNLSEHDVYMCEQCLKVYLLKSVCHLVFFLKPHELNRLDTNRLNYKTASLNQRNQRDQYNSLLFIGDFYALNEVRWMSLYLFDSWCPTYRKTWHRMQKMECLDEQSYKVQCASTTHRFDAATVLRHGAFKQYLNSEVSIHAVHELISRLNRTVNFLSKERRSEFAFSDMARFNENQMLTSEYVQAYEMSFEKAIEVGMTVSLQHGCYQLRHSTLLCSCFNEPVVLPYQGHVWINYKDYIYGRIELEEVYRWMEEDRGAFTDLIKYMSVSQQQKMVETILKQWKRQIHGLCV